MPLNFWLIFVPPKSPKMSRFLKILKFSKSSVKFHEWISISGTKFWMEHFKLISSTKFQSFFSLNSLKFSEIYVDSACLFIFMCKQTLIYGIQNFIFVTADIIYLIFVKSSSEKITFLTKISQNSKVDIKGTLAKNHQNL